MDCSKLKTHISQIESVDFDRARQLQTDLAEKIQLNDGFSRIKTIAGLDVGFADHNRLAIGGIVVLSYPEFKVLDMQRSLRPVVFPYVPGYLSFREVPVLLDAYAKLDIKPDLLLCDGQGVAHPRRFGLACHLGIILQIPAIGAAKSRLLGSYDEPAGCKGAISVLMDKDERIGTVVRTRNNTKPLFVSPGHKISFQSAVTWTLNCCPRFRLPETTRHAHKLVSG